MDFRSDVRRHCRVEAVGPLSYVRGTEFPPVLVHLDSVLPPTPVYIEYKNNTKGLRGMRYAGLAGGESNPHGVWVRRQSIHSE